MKPDTVCSVQAQESHPWHARQGPAALICPSPPHCTWCSWGLHLQPQHSSSFFAKQEHLFTEAASKVSVPCVNFPSRWLVLGNNRPRRLACPSPHVLTAASAKTRSKKTQMMFWGRDKVWKTWNCLLRLALFSDQTHQCSLRASLKGHSQHAAKGVRPAQTRASKSKVQGALKQVCNFGMETHHLLLRLHPRTVYTSPGVNRSKVKVNLSSTKAHGVGPSWEVAEEGADLLTLCSLQGQIHVSCSWGFSQVPCTREQLFRSPHFSEQYYTKYRSQSCAVTDSVTSHHHNAHLHQLNKKGLLDNASSCLHGPASEPGY